MTASLRSTLLPIVRHCATIERANGDKCAVDEQLEIECRMRLSPEEFYALFAKLASTDANVLTQLGATKQRDAVYRPPRDARQASRNGSAGANVRPYRSRLCYHPTLAEPLFGVEKHTLLNAERTLVRISESIEMRVDASREVYVDAKSVLDSDASGASQFMYWRSKDRRSFVLQRDAPLWQLDLTHIVEHRDAAQTDAKVQYELEFELAPSALAKAEPNEAVEQLQRLLAFVLGA